jgi:hypothetical protein
MLGIQSSSTSTMFLPLDYGNYHEMDKVRRIVIYRDLPPKYPFLLALCLEKCNFETNMLRGLEAED